jgi:hypothetical protein
MIVTELLKVAEGLLGRKLRTKRQALLDALSPEGFVAARTITGGPAPQTVAGFLTKQTKQAAADQRWRKAKAARLAAFPAQLKRAAKRLLSA